MQFELTQSIEILASGPLRNRVPIRDAQGNRVSDFMILIPRLKHKPEWLIRKRVERIQKVLSCYCDTIVFAELNVTLNLLWLSVKPVPGICMELTTAIRAHVPEAVLVGHGGV